MSSKEEIRRFCKNLDRSLFIEEESSKALSGIDRALPIGYGQTISQPSLVWDMTVWLDISQNHRVLEIGTGSGYQTRILAEFSGKVYTVEYIEELSLAAEKRLSQMGVKNIEYKVGDGSFGWEENAPYDRIMVTAAAGKIPDSLISQLAPGGKLIIPVGTKWSQKIVRLTKSPGGVTEKEYLASVVFVELKGDYRPE